MARYLVKKRRRLIDYVKVPRGWSAKKLMSHRRKTKTLKGYKLVRASNWKGAVAKSIGRKVKIRR